MLNEFGRKVAPRIVVLGPPGSGKGTHSKNLSKSLGIPVYGAGDLLRLAALKDKKIKRILGAGKLVPARLIDDLIKKKVKMAKGGVIIEGYPREMNRLRLLKKYFNPDIVVFLNISRREVVRRLGGRRVCGKCGEVYHLIYKKPRRKGICDKCGGRLLRRHDETPQAIKERISVFQKETIPIIGWYKKQGLVLEIDGTGRSIKDVSRELIKSVLLVLSDRSDLSSL